MHIRDSIWPAYTCVACYVYHSLKKYNISLDPGHIARSLNITVSKDVNNPFGLNSSRLQDELGLTSSLAIININNFLGSLEKKLVFRHIPFSSVPFKMFDEVAEEFIKKNIPVGIGYDFNIVTKQNESFKHISFINNLSNEWYILEDYYLHDRKTLLQIKSEELIKSVFDIKDGFWVIAEQSELNSKLF